MPNYQHILNNNPWITLFWDIRTSLRSCNFIISNSTGEILSESRTLMYRILSHVHSVLLQSWTTSSFLGRSTKNKKIFGGVLQTAFFVINPKKYNYLHHRSSAINLMHKVNNDTMILGSTMMFSRVLSWLVVLEQMVFRCGILIWIYEENIYSRWAEGRRN